MKREALIRQLRKECRSKGLTFRVDEGHGKGSHYRIHVGDRFTTIKSGELSPGYVKLIRKQLGLH